jgi:hypothetical protein
MHDVIKLHTAWKTHVKKRSHNLFSDVFVDVVV